MDQEISIKNTNSTEKLENYSLFTGKFPQIPKKRSFLGYIFNKMKKIVQKIRRKKNKSNQYGIKTGLCAVSSRNFETIRFDPLLKLNSKLSTYSHSVEVFGDTEKKFIPLNDNEKNNRQSANQNFSQKNLFLEEEPPLNKKRS